MGHARKKSSKATGKSIPLIIGVVIGLAILLSGTALMANGVSTEGEYTVTKIGVPITCLLAGFLGALTAGLTVKEKGFTQAVIVAGILIFTLLCITVFGFDGLNGGIWKSLGTITVGALIAGWISQKGKGRPKHRK